MEDDFFGSLLFVECKQPGHSYFEGRRLFRPTGHLLDLAVDGELPGPGAAQYAFYEQVEARYTELVPAVQQLIENEARHWLRPAGIRDFIAEFWPVHISIPTITSEVESMEWELAFETVHDKNHTFTIMLQGVTPRQLCIDG
ncbi:hypothetical protein LGH70_07835 [Hymenobacter sp. BT635]|uniref:DUF2004 domain-containing protein n=1 Tax=Hymenobacter nitidus TaxID=2880929 RepID=A0ABS8ACP9_9BACT|nr:hypothetical protein [Hymenobacter nitidus]MCB2377487.1 hypothetical protein [Hymenobacter nitidus]